jgi:L-alanine-DL-glutamate epimerase-like enolase superfamily enzyme
MAAVEVAVWDALGHRAGCSVARLLSRMPAESVELYVSGLRRGSVEERKDLLARLIREGFSGAKIFVDADMQGTLAEVAALRADAPSSFKLMVDALWSYPDVASASAARRRLADYQVNWLECPLVPEDFEAHAELARAPGAPVALGEHFFTHYASSRWLRGGLLHVFQPDICRTGVSNGWLQAGIAREANVRVTPHMGSGTPIVQAAALSFAAACRADEPCEYQLDLAGLMPDAFATSWIPMGGRMPLPDAPGLGVAVNEGALEQATASVQRWRAPTG